MIANTSRLSTFAFIALFCGCNSHTSKDDVAAEVVAEVPQIEHPESNPINVGDSFTSSDRILTAIGAKHRGRFSDNGSNKSAWVLPGYRIVVLTLSDATENAQITEILVGETGKGDHAEFSLTKQLRVPDELSLLD